MTEATEVVIRVKPKIEAVARALCSAEGHDPDLPVLVSKVPALGAKGHVLVGSAVPGWMLYTWQAQLAIAAIEKYQSGG